MVQSTMTDPLPFPWLDVAIILALVALNGVFAMSELAIVSSRKARLEGAAQKGSRGAAAAISLAEDPGKFLSTVQIGITLIGIIAGAYSGASLGQPVADRLELWLGLTDATSNAAGLALVIGLTTYASLIIGELVPKQFALRSPEPIATLISLPMIFLSKVAAPLVWLLDKSTGLVFRLLRMNRESENRVTAEELHLLVAEATRSGVIEEHERSIISGVVRLADRPVREVMTPRTDVEWVDVDLGSDALFAKLAVTPHTRLVVAEGSIDAVLGVVEARDIVAALVKQETLSLRVLMREAPVLPDQVDAMDALTVLRRSGVPMGMVHDEYGHFEGIVTPADLLAAIAGNFASDADADEAPHVVKREDGSLLVSGQMAADALAERIGIDLPEDRDFATVAGLALSVIKRLPEEGDHFTEQGWRFEIVDMDGRKIDKLLVEQRD